MGTLGRPRIELLFDSRQRGYKGGRALPPHRPVESLGLLGKESAPPPLLSLLPTTAPPLPLIPLLLPCWAWKGKGSSGLHSGKSTSVVLQELLRLKVKERS